MWEAVKDVLAVKFDNEDMEDEEREAVCKHLDRIWTVAQ